MMFCPACGHLQTCPCPACQGRIPTEKPWKWLEDDFISCGSCGLTKHCDWWESLCADSHQAKEKPTEP